MSPLSFISALLVAQLSSSAAPPPPADLTLPPETARIVLIAEGRGTQNYTCTAVPTGYAWTFTMPEAQLFNLATGKSIGHHGAGPAWTLDDGSSVQGSVLTKKAADAPADVPWLLLQARPVASAVQGTLSPVTMVRRYNTHGGNPPSTGCDAAHVGTPLAVPYSATYAFYTLGASLTRP